LEQSHRARVTLERQHAISQERQRFMRDLHDGMGGYLMTALSYTETTSGKDSTLHKILKLAVSDLRIVINSMEKDDEELMFMLAMFRQRIESMLNIQGIELVWQVEDEPSLASSDPSHSLQILRIVQEAVNNIAKHAQATQARLTLKKNAIVIADNGTGHTQVWTKGHGINNMRQRAQQINAVLDIDTTPSGVSVTLSWPLAMTSSVSVNDYP
jgi:Signal transduction histidine kinase